ncbi:MAG: hypothetical protein N2490_06585 [Ignavibacteria bacterium]|nr:hypothetical protein [Ignavibacteria bacterium]
MKIKIFSIAVVIGLLLSGVGYSQYNFSDGLKAASSSGKMVLVSIYTPDDAWSKKMESVYSSGNVPNLMHNFIFVKLNASGSERYNYLGREYSASDLSKLLGATGYPTHSFLNPDGSIIKFKYNGNEYNGYPGYLDAGDFEKLLNFFINKNYLNSDLSNFL